MYAFNFYYNVSFKNFDKHVLVGASIIPVVSSVEETGEMSEYSSILED